MLNICRKYFKLACEVSAWIILVVFAIGGAIGGFSVNPILGIIGFALGAAFGLLFNIICYGFIATFLCMGEDVREIKEKK